jgi:hypothetical protein
MAQLARERQAIFHTKQGKTPTLRRSLGLPLCITKSRLGFAIALLKGSSFSLGWAYIASWTVKSIRNS